MEVYSWENHLFLISMGHFPIFGQQISWQISGSSWRTSKSVGGAHQLSLVPPLFVEKSNVCVGGWLNNNFDCLKHHVLILFDDLSLMGKSHVGFWFVVEVVKFCRLLFFTQGFLMVTHFLVDQLIILIGQIHILLAYCKSTFFLVRSCWIRKKISVKPQKKLDSIQLSFRLNHLNPI